MKFIRRVRMMKRKEMISSGKHVPLEVLQERKKVSHITDSSSVCTMIPEQTGAFLRIFERSFKSKEEKFLENSVTLNQKIYEAGIELRKALILHKRRLAIKY